MKIAYITEGFPQRNQPFILSKVTELLNRGHEVTVFTRFIRDMDAHPDIMANLKGRMKIVKLPVPDRVRPKDTLRGLARSLTRPDRMLQCARRSVAEKERFPPLLTWNKSLPFLKGGFDLVHAHFGQLGRDYMEVASALNTPMIVSFRGTDASVELEADPPSFRKVFELADWYITCSEYIKGILVRHGAPSQRVSVLPEEIDTSYFKFHDRSSRKRDVLRIISVGRFHWVKGFNYALDAMALLKKRGVNFKYLLVGGGERTDEFEMSIRDQGLEDYVELKGTLDREDIKKLLNDSDIFLLPSMTENLNVAILEAQATGLPVVATNVGGVPEQVSEGDTGLLVPSRAPYEMADKLQYLIEHPEQRAEMGRKGRAQVEQKFSMEVLFPRLLEVYEKVASMKAR